MTPYPLTLSEANLINNTLLESRECIERLESKVDELRSEKTRLEMLLACVLPIAELNAVDDVQQRTCEYVRVAIGERTLGVPPRTRPYLIVDGGRRVS